MADCACIARPNIVLVSQPGDSPVKCTAIDVRETEPFGELACDRAFTGSRRSINGNHRKFGDGIRIQFFSKTSAGLNTGVGGFSSGVKNLCNWLANPG